MRKCETPQSEEVTENPSNGMDKKTRTTADLNRTESYRKQGQKGREKTLEPTEQSEKPSQETETRDQT